MPEDTVVPFPGRDFALWLAWAECELSILGFDIHARAFDWRGAFERGLRPEEAAAEAARVFEAS